MSGLHALQITMGSQNILHSLFLLLFFLSSSLQSSNGGKPASKLYVVYLGERKHQDSELVTASHRELLSSLFASKEEAVNSIVYSYRHAFSGFAAKLTESQADQLAELAGVVSVEPNRMIPVHTTRSWDFLGLGYNHSQPDGLLKKGRFGEDIIIGFVDTGIWPESRSFDDHGYGPIPSHWKGTCKQGEITFNQCNLKIIGARWYDKDVDPSDLAVEFRSPCDYMGHGTHTASIAAGTHVINASFWGLGTGAAQGGAPRARIAVYKACWGLHGMCGTASLLMALDDAVHDGVDILSLSLGEPLAPIFATIHTVVKGITVVFAAGNDGPFRQTLSNDLPWVITIAASSIDRSFPTVITLGSNQTVLGQSLYYAAIDEGFKELLSFPNCSRETISSANVTGKIVLCETSLCPSKAIAIEPLKKAKARGLILVVLPFGAFPACNDFMCVLVDRDAAQQIYEYVDTLRMTSPIVNVSPACTFVGSGVAAPRVAFFSSRGPSLLYPDLIKPDITAPGVKILAAVRDSYEFMSGTSMSCPHVSGIVAILKSAHPDWSPAAIKSALITTTYSSNAYDFPIQADGIPRKLADPFDFGSGHVDPNRAMDPGLIYDIDPNYYFKFFKCTNSVDYNCSLAGPRLYNLNLPSIAISDLKTSVTVQRTVTNVGDASSTYRAMVVSPSGVKMTVEPVVLEFNASKRMHTFALTFTALKVAQGDFTFGSLTWVDGGKHSVRIPIAARVIVQDQYPDV